MDVKQFIRSKRLPLIFLLLGAVGGFLYWRFIGCVSGTCLIKSVWYWSTLWGAAAGYLIGDILNDVIVKIRQKRREEN